MTKMIDLGFTDWTNVNYRKSSYSNGSGGNCVEVGAAAGAFGIRDTKNRDGGTVVTTAASWTSFILAVKNGRFDR